MGGNPEATQPRHVFDNGRRRTAERIRSRGHVERDVMPLVGADLDGVDAQHAVYVGRRIGRTRAVAMVGEDDEAQPGARGSLRDAVLISRAVRARRVNVVSACHRARGNVTPGGGVEPKGSSGENEEEEREGQNDTGRQNGGQWWLQQAAEMNGQPACQC
jgi:hypothetical protein